MPEKTPVKRIDTDRQLPPRRVLEKLRSYDEGSHVETRVYERDELGQPKAFLERREGVISGSPLARLYNHHILGVLHKTFPEVFPATIEVRSLKFENDTPVMESVEAKTVGVTVKAYKRWKEDLRTLENAGIDVDTGKGDIKFIEEDGRVQPIVIEVLRIDFRKLDSFMRGLENKAVDPQRVQEVRRFISSQRDSLVDELITGLKHSNNDVRVWNAIDLGKLENERSIPAFIDRLRNDDEEDVRFLSAERLGGFNNERARTALEEVGLKDPVDRIRAISAVGLTKIGDKDSIPILEAAMDRERWEFIAHVDMKKAVAALRERHKVE